MQVKFIRERSLPFVGSRGLGTRVFAVGEIVDLPEIHAQSYIADGNAVIAPEKPAKAEKAEKAAPAAEAPKPAAKPSK